MRWKCIVGFRILTLSRDAKWLTPDSGSTGRVPWGKTDVRPRSGKLTSAHLSKPCQNHHRPTQPEPVLLRIQKKSERQRTSPRAPSVSLWLAGSLLLRWDSESLSWFNGSVFPRSNSVLLTPKQNFLQWIVSPAQPILHRNEFLGTENANSPYTNQRSHRHPSVDDRSPVVVIGTESIRDTFDDLCLQQAINSRAAPGVTNLVLNPDAHCGYGAPIGCVMVSPTHIYPGPVGVDIKCSMSLLQLDLPEDAVDDRRVRRALIDAICERIPTGAGRGSRHVAKGRHVDESLGLRVLIEGASSPVCEALGIPTHWASRCEDAAHVGHDDTSDALARRIQTTQLNKDTYRFLTKMQQLGSYGGGNHFGECEVVELRTHDPKRMHAAKVFGLRDGHVAFLSHCGSRGIGHQLAMGQFRALQHKFAQWDIPLPGNDRELVYAPLDHQRLMPISTTWRWEPTSRRSIIS